MSAAAREGSEAAPGSESPEPEPLRPESPESGSAGPEPSGPESGAPESGGPGPAEPAGDNPSLFLRITEPVGTVVQIGRIVVEPAPAGARPSRPAGLAAAGLIDREPLLDRIRELLAWPEHAGAPALLLHGPPGIGTTTLMLAAAARLHDHFAGGARFVSLREGLEPGHTGAAGQVAGAQRALLLELGVADRLVPVTIAERAAMVRALLNERPTLLLLDDAGSAAAVRAFLPGGCSAALATADHPMPELSLDDVVSLAVGGLDAQAGAALCRALGSGPGWQADPVATAALVAACHGSPLALRLLASCLGARGSPRAALAVIGDPPDARAAAEAAVRCCLPLLDAEARAVLDAAVLVDLPVLGAAQCRAALGAAATRDAVTAALERLAAIGMLSERGTCSTSCGSEPTFTVPASVRAVLQPLRTVRARSAGSVPTGPAGERVAPAQVAAEQAGTAAPPVRTDGPEPGEPRGTEEAAGTGTGPGTEVGSTGSPAWAPADALAAAARAAAQAADRATAARVLVRLAAARQRAGDSSAALATAARALDIADEVGDRATTGCATRVIADVLASWSAPDADVAYDTAIGLLDGSDDLECGRALRGRGRLAGRLGRQAAALADLRAALDRFRAVPDLRSAATAWQEIARIEEQRGRPAEAIAAHRSALAELAEAGDPAARAWSQVVAGTIQVGRTPPGPLDALTLPGETEPHALAARSVQALHVLDPHSPSWAAIAALVR